MTKHFEFLVEEHSMEAFLSEFLPRVLGDRVTYVLHTHQGKHDLLRKLEKRLRGYSKWIADSTKIFVVVDRDDDDCKQLKIKLEKIASDAGVISKTVARDRPWQVVNRIAIEELEAWFFGEWASVRKVYPKVSGNVSSKVGLRLPDEVAGGTWEALERIFKKAGYFPEGLRKVECARTLGAVLDPSNCTSPSFSCFYSALISAIEPAQPELTQAVKQITDPE